MAEVVGTAFVRIKAITKGLGKEIEKSVKKGMADAKLDKVGEEEGDKAGKGFGDKFSESSGKSIKKNSKKAVGGDALAAQFDDTFKKVKQNFEQLEFDFDAPRESFKQLQLDLGDFEMPDFSIGFDDRDTRSFFERFRDGVRSNDRESQNWLGRLRSGFRTISKSLDLDVGKSLSGALDKFRELGKIGLGGIAKSLLGLGGVVIAALPYIQDAGAAVIAYATGLVAQVGFLVTALGGLGVAAGAALGAAAFAVLPIMLAFKAETPALQEFKDSMAAAGEEFQIIGEATQKHLLPGLDEAVFILGDLIPLFAEYGEVVGEIVGGYSVLAANILTGEKAQGRFQLILEASLSILEKFFAIIINVGDILSGIFVAALPVAIRFADTLLDVVTRWAAIVNFNLNSGHLADVFDLWYTRAEVLMGGLADLSGAVFDILQVGADSSDSVFERFAVWAEEYRAWTSSEVGQNKLKLIFDNALAVMREVNGVIAELFGGMGRLEEEGGVDGIVSALQNFREIIPDLKERWAEMYDSIKEVVGYLADRAVTVFNDLREPLGEVGDNIKELLESMEDTNSLAVFVDLMVVLTDTLNTLLNLPGLGEFLSYMLALGAALKIAAVVLGPFISLFRPMPAIIGGVAAAVGFLAGGFANLFAGGTLLAGLGGPIIGGGATVAIAGVATALAAVVAVVGAAILIFKHWDTIVAAVNVAWDALWESVLAVGRFLKDPMARITQLKENLEDLAGSLGGVLLNALSTAGEALGNLGGTILSALGDALSALPGIVGSALSALPEILGKAALFAIEALVTVIVGAFLALPITIYLLITKVGPVLVEAFKAAFGFLVEALPAAFGAVLGFFQSLPGLVMGALGSLIDTVVGFASNIPGLISSGLSALSDIGTVIGDALGNAGEAVGGFLSTIPGALADFAEEVPGLFGEAMEAVFGAVSDGFENVFSIFGDFPGQAMEALEEVPGAMIDGIKSLPGLLGDALSAAAEFAFEALRATIHRVLQGVLIIFFGIPVLIFLGLKTFGPKLVEIFAGAIGTLITALSGLITGVIQFFIDLPGRIITALSSLGSTIGSYITDVAWPFVTEAVSSAIESVIQFFRDLPGNLVDAIVSAWQTFWTYWTTLCQEIRQFIEDRIADVIQFFKDLPGNIKDAVVSAWQTFWGYYTGLGYEIRNFIGDRITDIVNFFSELPGRITTALSGLGATLLGIGQTVIGKLLEGLGAAPGRIADLAGSMLRAVQGLGKSLINGVIDALNNLLPNEIGEVKVRGITILPGIPLPDNPIPRLMSKGGFVGMSGVFGSGPVGTDTIPAWLTPGEFVLRRSVAQAIPARTLQALNDGNPQLISMLSSISRGRPGAGNASLADVTATSARGGAGGGMFGPNSVVIYAQGTSAREVYNEFDHRVNWKLTSRGDR